MVRLTEEMIVARTRVSDMGNVKKLNCWGAELSDISVLRKLVNVEVLSLSVNCITSLSDIQNCKSLQELYIRKNKIQDLGEICWLRDLPKLKSLWLEENPCVQNQGELYRVTIIRNLPQLQKLDNVAVQSEEMADAVRRGIELVHPLERDPAATPAASFSNSYQPRDSQPRNSAGRDEYHEERFSSGRDDQPLPTMGSRKTSYVEQQSAETNYPPSRRVSNQVFDLPDNTRIPSSPPSSPTKQQQIPAQYGVSSRSTYGNIASGDQDSSYGGPEYHSGRRYSHQEGGNVRHSPRLSQPALDENVRRMSMHDSIAYDEERHNIGNPSSYNSAVERSGYNSQMRPANYGPPPSNYGPSSDLPPSSYSYQSGGYYEYSPRPPPQLPDTTPSRAILARHYEQTYDQVNQQIESAQQHIASKRKSFSPERNRRPKNRNSNILSAVLCLIKELDGPSLEVAEMAVRCRIEELDD